MNLKLLYFCWSFIISSVLARPQAQNKPNADVTPSQEPATNACGDLIRAAETDPYFSVRAIQVYNCFATVPFNPAVATRFIKYWQDTLQFHSGLDYLKSPPQGYQKPAADLVAGLQQIQNNVQDGKYNSEYTFEADLQRLIYSANDEHVSLSAGLLASFRFANPWSLTTLSLDGIALPKVYLTSDLYGNQTRIPQDTWQPSALSQINGVEVTEYLSNFAALNSKGTLEPHADWNTLMENPVLDVLLDQSTWTGEATFYPGDTFNFVFENGSTLTDSWLALYSDPTPTGPLETGGDFYNFFVLGIYPASYNPNVTLSRPRNVTWEPTAENSLIDYSTAYPAIADIYQANLTIDGYVTGYFIRDSSLAVLSIPSFYAKGEAIQAFSDTVQDFLTRAKAQGMTKVLIDLQHNGGGDVILAYNTFKQFFPSLDPYAASKRRTNAYADVLGNIITNYWSNLTTSDREYITGASDEWIATARLNAATGLNFTSWPELFGPTFDGVGNFTRPERLNYTSYVFDYSALGGVNPPSPLFNSGQAAPYAAADIVIFSDALCSSACALFLEMMRHDAGVKNVVIGGRPEYGPMQTPSRSRAARAITLLELDADFGNAIAIDETTRTKLPDRNNTSLYVKWGGVSLRESVRPNDPIPLSMKYEAADCRIFWTPETFNNFTNLWQYAANAIWTDPSRCVRDSTGYASSQGQAPPRSVTPPGVEYDSNGIVSFTDISNRGISLVGNSPMPDADEQGGALNTRPHYQDEASDNDATYFDGTGGGTIQNNNEESQRYDDAVEECVIRDGRPAPYCEFKRRKRDLLRSLKRRALKLMR